MRKFIQLQLALSSQLQRIQCQITSNWEQASAARSLEPALSVPILQEIEEAQLTLATARKQLGDLAERVENEAPSQQLLMELRNGLRQIVSATAEAIAKLEVRINAECYGAQGPLHEALAQYHSTLLHFRRSMTEFELAATKELDSDSFAMP